MNSSEIITIRRLMDEAKHSFVSVATLTDNPKIAFILAKWPDVLCSILDYVERGDSLTLGFNRIISDFGPLVYSPYATIAESYLDVLKSAGTEDSALRAEFDTIMKSTFVDPTDVKIKLVELINKIVPLLNEAGHKVEPVRGLSHGNRAVR